MQSETKLRKKYVQFIQGRAIQVSILFIYFARDTYIRWRSFYICGFKNLTFRTQTRDISI